MSTDAGMGRKEERISYEAIKEKKADIERELQGKKGVEKERNEKSAEEELKWKHLLLKEEDERAKKRVKVERSKEFEKLRQEVEEFEQEISRRKDEFDREVKRMAMERKEERKKEAKRKNLKDKILRRENDLERASLVKNWKAAAAELPPSTPNENPTLAEQILEAAKRGPKHDLCEECAIELDFCVHDECTTIGCSTCFDEYFTMCSSLDCFNRVCVQHSIKCFVCEDPHCNECKGNTCDFCEAYACAGCDDDAGYCCPEDKEMWESLESLGLNFFNP